MLPAEDLWHTLVEEAREDAIDTAAAVSAALAEQELSLAGFDVKAGRAGANATIADLSAAGARANGAGEPASEPAAWVSAPIPPARRERGPTRVVWLAAALAAAATAGGILCAAAHRSKPPDRPVEAPSATVIAEPPPAPVALVRTSSGQKTCARGPGRRISGAMVRGTVRSAFVLLALATLGAFAAIAAGCSKDASPVPTAAADPNPPHATPPAATSTAPPAPPPPPPGPPADCNVVLISIDSLRADMPWNGYERPIAPRLTELEKTAVSYTHAHSVSSYTAMSLGGVLGGRLPSELHRSGYFFGTYQKDVFFPKLLQKAGVHTMGVMAHLYFQQAGLEQGFDAWRIVPGVTFDGQTDRDITSPQSEQVSEELLNDPANDSRRFFFWVHFLDPHDLYLHHDGIDWGPSPRDRYDGEVTFTDRHVAKLLDLIASKPWAKRTILIVTSDHGEEFGEHQMTRHGFEVWETLTHVPLMFVAPGAKPHKIDVLRSGLDLAPTILDFFGIAAPASFEGHSLAKEIYGGDAEQRDVVVDLPMTSNSSRRRALLHGTEKLICFDNDGFCKLYDLEHDPLEQSPTMRGPEWADMKARYDALLKNITEVTPFACTGDCLDADHKKKLAEAAAAAAGKASP